MAEHILLSSIYDLINDLVKPRNEGRGATSIQEKPISSLHDLSDGKRLAKLLRKDCSNSSNAKTSLTNVLYAFFHSRKKPIRFTTEQIRKIIDYWTDNKMINFIVLFAKCIVKGIGRVYYNRTMIERNRQHFDCIGKYYKEAKNNCVNIINGQEFDSLIDQSFYECQPLDICVGFNSTADSDLMTDDESTTEAKITESTVAQIDYDELFDDVINKMCDNSVPLECDRPVKQTILCSSMDNIKHLEDGNYQCGDCKKTSENYRVITGHIGGKRRGMNGNVVSINCKKQKKGQICDHCKLEIKGIRYKCTVCEDFDLCKKCKVLDGVHDDQHSFSKIKKWVKRFYLPKKAVPRNVDLTNGSEMITTEQKPTKILTDGKNTSLTVSAETQTVVERKPAAIQTDNDCQRSFSISQTQTDVKPNITISTQTVPLKRTSETQTEHNQSTLQSENNNLQITVKTEAEDSDCEIIFETSPKSGENLNKNIENDLLRPVKREPSAEFEQNMNAFDALVCVNCNEANNRDTNANKNSAQNMVTESFVKLSESRQSLIENQEFLIGMQRIQINDFERRERALLERIKQLESVVLADVEHTINAINH